MVNEIAIAPCFFAFFLFLVQAKAQLAPALYIFGDSYVDPGNNKFLPTLAQANTPPNGIDHPLGVTGRFTNGLTAVDFFAKWMGLNFQPPAKDPKVKLHPTYQGINYGSGSSGLLPESGSIAGENLYLKEQVDLFMETVRQQLAPHFKDPAKLAYYLSRSLFYIHTGHNDYSFCYLSSNSTYTKQYSPKQFADFLLKKMESNLKVLYELGARKFIVSEISPLGCIPEAFSKLTTPLPPPPKCIDTRNAPVKIFNSKLAAKLQYLGSVLKGSTFVVAKEYGIILDMVENPKKYGVSDVRSPCATPESVCKDRNSHLYWDSIHPTQIVFKNFATQCFNGTNVCVPLNIQELAKKK